MADAKQTYKTVLTTGVHFTPLQDDAAHADLTFDGWLVNESKEEREPFLLWLSAMLQGLHPAQLRLLPDAHIPPKPVDSQFMQRRARLLIFLNPACGHRPDGGATIDESLYNGH